MSTARELLKTKQATKEGLEECYKYLLKNKSRAKHGKTKQIRDTAKEQITVWQNIIDSYLVGLMMDATMEIYK